MERKVMRVALLLLAALVLAVPALAEKPAKPLIKDSVLNGKWTGANGSSLTFKGGQCAYKLKNAKPTSGPYRLEGYRLFINDVAVGWIGLEKPNEFRLNFTKTDRTRFIKH